MEVILLEDLPQIGHKGDLKNVRPGFFRNYLLPYQKAVAASDATKKLWDSRRAKLVLAKETLKSKAKEFIERLAGKTFVVKKKTTKKGTLYSAITAEKLVELLAHEAHVELAPEMFVLKTPIKASGKHDVTIRIEDGVEAKISLEIQAA